ncbi:MAG TPA: ATP-grasp domain-containing protein [Thermoanaerobaculia bacterium]|nr:ATP-grasp domain-containing protein [Thermoanaerobaculia bacterium]
MSRVASTIGARASRGGGAPGPHRATRRGRVLVMDAETTKALAIVRALGGAMEVRTASRRRQAIAAWSRFVVEHLVHPVAAGDGLSAWVREVCRSRGVEVVLCPEERSSWLLARDREPLEADGVLLPLPPREVLETAMDKARTLEAARAAGVPVPPTIVLENAAQAGDAARELGWPVVVKPRFSHYWTGERFIACGGVSYAANDAELARAMARQAPGAPPPLLQSFVSGGGLGLFFVLAPGGALAAEFAHERLRDLRPTGSGSVLRRSVRVDPHLRELALALLRGIGWWGVAMVEFRGDLASGRACLMEINGRFWGSLQLAIDAGVNFPRILIEVARGELRPPPSYREGVVLRWWLGDLARVGRVLRGKPPGFAGSFPSRVEGLAQFLGPQPPRTRNEVMRWEDPLPAIGEVLSLLRR